jgi:YjbE family integral membrane protein
MLQTYWPEISAFLQVLFIDVVLAGDNAVVVGMAAAGVRPEIRAKVILAGIGAAVVLRILFAVAATLLLGIVGLTLAGGILLLWVCWKMYREIAAPADEAAEGNDLAADPKSSTRLGQGRDKTFFQAMVQILVADVSMSLDNVLAVAGAAQEHPYILALGLLLSVGLMGAAASFIASLLARHRWIAWIGLLIILYVALEMVWTGVQQVACVDTASAACRMGLDGWLLSLVRGG